MARYRIGNRYLTQEEYNRRIDLWWIWGLFLAGSVFTGWLVHTYLVNPDWHKAIRFVITTVPAVLVGVLLAKLRNYIQMLIALCIVLFILAVVVKCIASVI